MHQSPRILAIGMIFVSSAILGGCESPGYYSQAVAGQLRILRQRESVDDVLSAIATRESNAADELLQSQLLLSQRLLDFAERRLDLTTGGRYRTYVALSQPFVVSNIFASPALSLDAKTWCYPFVGCAPYRGYFNRQSAETYRARLADEGFDTYIGGVAAYSTLGWFDDPLLSTFLSWPEPELARLLMHELAHSRIWLKGDVAFNEGFASFVGREGMAQWLAAQGKQTDYSAYLDRRRAWRRLVGMLEATRNQLQDVYEGSLSKEQKLTEKARLFGAVRICYRANLEKLGTGRYDRLMEELNNAYLVSLATYRDTEPAFAALFADVGQQWPAFYARVDLLKRLSEAERGQQLLQLSEQHVGHERDDKNPDDIQCEALPRHNPGREATRAEYNHIGRSRNG